MAGGSLDQDGVIVSYAWDFGDGEDSDEVNPQHVFTQQGEYTVTLSVTDNDNNVHSDTSVVSVILSVSLTIGISPDNSGMVKLDPEGGLLEAGTIVSLTAKPNPGFMFVAYLDENNQIVSEDVIYSFEIVNDTTLTAQYSMIAQGSLQLQVNVLPVGAGSVVLDPPGGVYQAGDSVAVAAFQNVGYEFLGFFDKSGSMINADGFFVLQMVSDLTLTAKFAALPPTSTSMATLSVIVTQDATGTVTLDPPGGTYPIGTVVTMSAESAAGYEFVQYSGGVTSTEAVIGVTITGNTNVQAEFDWLPQMGNPGNILVTNFAGNSVLEFDRFDGTLLGRLVQPGAGDLSLASGIDFGPDGNLYVNGFANDRIMRFEGRSGVLMDAFASLAGNLTVLALRFGPQGDLFVADATNNNILKYDGVTGESTGIFVNPRNSNLFLPVGMRFNADGNLFVVSQGNGLIIQYNGVSGATIGTYANLASVGFSLPIDLDFNDAGDLFVTTSGSDSVARVAADTGTMSTFVSPMSGGLDSPAGILVNPDSGNVLVANQSTDQILEYDGTTGDFVRVFAIGVPGEVVFFMAHRAK